MRGNVCWTLIATVLLFQAATVANGQSYYYVSHDRIDTPADQIYSSLPAALRAVQADLLAGNPVDDHVIIRFTMGDHYILPRDLSDDYTYIDTDNSLLTQTKSPFGIGGDLIDVDQVTLAGMTCDEVTAAPDDVPASLRSDCAQTGEKPTIFPKVHHFHLRFFQNLSVSNMTLDGSELMIWRGCTASGNSSCCDSGSGNDLLDQPSRCCDSTARFQAGGACQACEFYAERTLTYGGNTITIPAGVCDFFDVADDPFANVSTHDDKYNVHLPLFILDQTLQTTGYNSARTISDSTDANTLASEGEQVDFTTAELNLNDVDIQNFVHQPTSMIYLKTEGRVTVVDSNFVNVTTKYGIITNNFSKLNSVDAAPTSVYSSVKTVDADFWTAFPADWDTLVMSTEQINSYTCLKMSCASNVTIASSNFEQVNDASAPLASPASFSFNYNSGAIRLAKYYGSLTFNGAVFEEVKTNMMTDVSDLSATLDAYTGGTPIYVSGMPFEIFADGLTVERSTGHVSSGAYFKIDHASRIESDFGTAYEHPRETPPTSYIVLQNLTFTDNHALRSGALVIFSNMMTKAAISTATFTENVLSTNVAVLTSDAESQITIGGGSGAISAQFMPTVDTADIGSGVLANAAGYEASMAELLPQVTGIGITAATFTENYGRLQASALYLRGGEFICNVCNFTGNGNMLTQLYKIVTADAASHSSGYVKATAFLDSVGSVMMKASEFSGNWVARAGANASALYVTKPSLLIMDDVKFLNHRGQILSGFSDDLTTPAGKTNVNEVSLDAESQRGSSVAVFKVKTIDTLVDLPDPSTGITGRVLIKDCTFSQNLFEPQTSSSLVDFDGSSTDGTTYTFSGNTYQGNLFYQLSTGLTGTMANIAGLSQIIHAAHQFLNNYEASAPEAQSEPCDTEKNHIAAVDDDDRWTSLLTVTLDTSDNPAASRIFNGDQFINNNVKGMMVKITAPVLETKPVMVDNGTFAGNQAAEVSLLAFVNMPIIYMHSLNFRYNRGNLINTDASTMAILRDSWVYQNALPSHSTGLVLGTYAFMVAFNNDFIRNYQELYPPRERVAFTGVIAPAYGNVFFSFNNRYSQNRQFKGGCIAIIGAGLFSTLDFYYNNSGINSGGGVLTVASVNGFTGSAFHYNYAAVGGSAISIDLVAQGDAENISLINNGQINMVDGEEVSFEDYFEVFGQAPYPYRPTNTNETLKAYLVGVNPALEPLAEGFYYYDSVRQAVTPEVRQAGWDSLETLLWTSSGRAFCLPPHWSGDYTPPSLGSLLIVNNSRLAINGITAIGNVAETGAFLYLALIPTDEIATTVKNATITNNQATKSFLIKNIGCTLVIEDSTIKSNTALERSPGIYASFKKLTIKNTTFEDQDGVNQVSFLHAAEDLTLELEDVKFLQGNGNRGGAVLAEYVREITLRNVVFARNTASIGAAMALINTRKVLFEGENLFYQNSANKQAADIYIENCSDIYLNNIEFSGYGQNGYIVASSVDTFEINNCSFAPVSAPVDSDDELEVDELDFTFDGDFDEGDIGPIQPSVDYDSDDFGESLKSVETLTEETYSPLTIKDAKVLTLNAVKIHSLTGYNGGALNIQFSKISQNASEYKVTFEEVRISNCIAKNGGGAIYVENPPSISIKKSLFTNNHSTFGGAVEFRCIFNDCALDIDGSWFYYNYAEKAGGVLKWTEVEGFIDNTTTQVGNRALYGDFIASVPITLKKIDNEEDFSTTLTRRRLEERDSVDNVQSGGEFEYALQFALKDKYGQTVLTDDTSIAVIGIPDSESGKGIKLSNQTNRASMGVYTFEGLIVTAPPGTDIVLTISSEAIESTSSSDDGDVEEGVTDSDEATGEVIELDFKMRECLVGEILTSDNACFKCGSDTPDAVQSSQLNQDYTLRNDESSCQTCPSEAYCWGGANIAPRSGYWRYSETTSEFLECPHSDACLGMDTSKSQEDRELLGRCDSEEGYTGRLCASCKDGYVHSWKYFCTECNSIGLLILRLIGVSILVVAFIYWIVSTTLKGAKSMKNEAISVCLRILTNYFQLVILTAAYELNWPALMEQIFLYQEMIGSYSDQLFSFDCLLQEMNVSLEYTYFNMLLFALLPVILVAIACTFWLIYGYIKKKEVKASMITTIIILLFIIHPSVVNKSAAVLSCRSIGDGNRYITSNLELQCWTSEHYAWGLGVALPSLIIWGFGLPAVGTYLLVKNRHELFGNSVIKQKYGFLYAGYREQCYYWEALVVYRKLAISAISIFLFNINRNIQGAFALGVLVVALALQQKYRPFNAGELNRMEMQSLMVAFATIYFGLYYVTDKVSDGLKMVFVIIMILLNLYFLITWLKTVVVTLKKSKNAVHISHVSNTARPLNEVVAEKLNWEPLKKDDRDVSMDQGDVSINKSLSKDNSMYKEEKGLLEDKPSRDEKELELTEKNVLQSRAVRGAWIEDQQKTPGAGGSGEDNAAADPQFVFEKQSLVDNEIHNSTTNK